jgi:hypothetical protein
MSLESILSDLSRHAGLFDLDDGLGADLAEVASADVADTFDHECDPGGSTWPDLSSDYARWKEQHYPGRPMGVRTGYLREHLIGVPVVSAESVEIPIGDTPEASALAGYFNDGDDASNRPPREFIGLTERGVETSDQVCERRLDEGL